MAQLDNLRDLPSVDEIVSRLAPLAGRFPRELVVAEVRRVLGEMREAILAGRDAGAEPVEARVEAVLASLEQPSLRRVINATGVVLHTNLGRAPLPPFAPVFGYSNLEYDLEAGRRGKRDTHVSDLIERLFGAPGIAVNNNAAAVYLSLNELASGYEVVVSRGELIEIGDGFRIPDIMARSGAVLREVGTTNRTRIEDYRAALTERTRVLLRVHPSNFRMQGFTARPSLRELSGLARERGLLLYEDLGSGCVVDLRRYGVDEPRVEESLREGAGLVSFSGDKLLGGPQAGLLVGSPELVARLRRNPMFRVLRLDKLIYQALEVALRRLLLGRLDEIPALRMITASAGDIRQRAEALLGRVPDLSADLVSGESVIGGGATPEQSIPTCLIAVASDDVVALEARLRRGDPPVIARIENGRLLLDLRTVFPEEEPELAAALQARS